MYVLKIAVINIVNKEKKYAMNKDLCGGFGTADTYANSVYEKILSRIKRGGVRLAIM